MAEKNCAGLFDVEQWNVSYSDQTVTQDTIQSMSERIKILMSFSVKSVSNQNISGHIPRENRLLMQMELVIIAVHTTKIQL